MIERREQWSLLVKPTHACNLNCQYCYDQPFRERFGQTKMTHKLVEHIAKLASKYAEKVMWIWHGGEPTLMGVDWYIKAQEAFYRQYNTMFEQSMQSNGVALNEEWAALEKNFGVDIGMSFDVFYQNVRVGSQYVNLREKIDLFKRHGLNLGTISVINKESYKRQVELYEFFKQNKLPTPAFNHIYRSGGSLYNGLEVSAEEYCKEFITYYKYWLYDSSPDAIYERSAMEITSQVIGDRHLCCTHSDCRLNWIGVNPVGGVYPCDRYVPDKYYMGNIMDFDSIEALYNTEGFKRYYDEIECRFNTHCKECGYFDYCQGGCNANHIAVTGSADGVDEFSCELFRLKFNNAYDVLRNVDIYNDKLNLKFIKIALEHPFVSVQEIKHFLAQKGYNVDFDYQSSGKELLECTEFKVFRVFNVFKGVTNGHSNHKCFKLERNIVLDKTFDMKKLAENRWKLMEQIYQEHKDLINQILCREATAC